MHSCSKIAFVSAEVYPFSKVGGLGDVSGTLPHYLAKQGLDVAVLTPGYGSIRRTEYPIKASPYQFDIRMGEQYLSCGLSRWQSPANPNLSVYFIENEPYFGSRGVYTELSGEPCEDNSERFLLFSKAVLRVFKMISWMPDVIHCNDNHSASIPVYLRYRPLDFDYLKNTKTLLTLHNIAYQGITGMDQWERFNLPEELFYPTAVMEWYGQINPLKAGILSADAVSTVSPTHAREIAESQELSAGLKGVLAATGKPVRGILNGVDYTEWSPQTDTYITQPYTSETLKAKRVNKIALLSETGFPPDRVEKPLIGMVSRLVEQKGIAILIDSLERILALDVSVVILGSGEKEYEQALKTLADRFPECLKIDFSYNNPLSHKIIAGADMFLMPSRYEPCGITQMAALKYGTVPIVHKTGGLADTIDPWDGVTGNGFVFDHYSADDLVSTVKNALENYQQKERWHQIVRNGMSCDFSWDRSAERYIDLYQTLISE